MSSALRKARRGLAQGLALALAGWAARGGARRVRQIGRAVGSLHWMLAWPFWGRLRRDVSRALGVDRRRASRILLGGARTNDGAIFEALTLARPGADPRSLVDAVEIRNTGVLDDLAARGQGAILLGMHMGNGILLAGKLAAQGRPAHLVFRDPRRMRPGYLEQCIAATGATPIPLDRENPVRSFRHMLRVLTSGGLIFVLMDQASKQEGEIRSFLGKPQRTPTGVLKLAERTGVPLVPIDGLEREPNWVFTVREPLPRADGLDATLDAVVAHMEGQVRERPALWSWHQRRWKRYHFDPSAPVSKESAPCR